MINSDSLLQISNLMCKFEAELKKENWSAASAILSELNELPDFPKEWGDDLCKTASDQYKMIHHF